MAITSVTAFNAAIQGLSITGVTRSLAYMPPKIDSADCPLQFPRRLTSNETPLTADGSGGWPLLQAEIWIVLNPLLQSTNVDNFALAATLMDNTSTALRAIAGGALTKSKISWRQEMDLREVAGQWYWTVVCSITGNG